MADWFCNTKADAVRDKGLCHFVAGSLLISKLSLVMQIVVEESVFKSLMAQWEENNEPASLAASHRLATDNFCRLVEVTNASGMSISISLGISYLEGGHISKA